MMKPSVLFRVGYAWFETFNYGEIRLNTSGKTTTEHRIFEIVQLSHKEKRQEFTNRYMLVQRFAGRYSSPELTWEDKYNLLHRIRCPVRLQVPLKGIEIADKTPYVNLFDEILLASENMWAPASLTKTVLDSSWVSGLIKVSEWKAAA